jgi:hypothetical protein
MSKKEQHEETYKQPKDVPTPKTGGYPATGAKTTGIKVRGRDYQTKAKLARGPMA